MLLDKTTDRTSRLASAVARENYLKIRYMFWAESLKTPKVTWDPRPDQLKVGLLANVLGYWNEIRGDRELPSPDDIDPYDFKYALGYIMLLDVLNRGEDFHYRLYGSEIAAAYRRNLEGHRTSEFKDFIGKFSMAIYRAVLIRRIPVFTEHQPPPNVFVKSWRRLILPLAKNGEIVRLLVGSVPKDLVYGTATPED